MIKGGVQIMKIKSFGLLLCVVFLGLSLAGCGCFMQQVAGEKAPPKGPEQAQLVPPGAKTEMEVPKAEAAAPIPAAALADIYFDFDKADLSPQAQDKLRRAAEWLTTSANRTIVFRIEGNCDPRGTSEYNLGLGERRAQAAREFLVSLGVESSRIMTVSYGIERAQGTYEGNPDSPPSWAHDRRDDFIYISGGESSRNSSEMIFIIGSK